MEGVWPQNHAKNTKNGNHCAAEQSGGKTMARYGKKASQKVKRAMHERKKGTLKSGKGGKRVRSRKQAIAIGLSEARKSGAKVPRKKGTSSRKGTSRKRTSRKSTSRKK
jgi:hypothetical protein